MKPTHDLLVFAAVCELAGEARATNDELAADLVAIGVELVKVHRDAGVRRLPTAPAWFVPGGDA